MNDKQNKSTEHNQSYMLTSWGTPCIPSEVLNGDYKVDMHLQKIGDVRGNIVVEFRHNPLIARINE